MENRMQRGMATAVRKTMAKGGGGADAKSKHNMSHTLSDCVQADKKLSAGIGKREGCERGDEEPSQRSFFREFMRVRANYLAIVTGLPTTRRLHPQSRVLKAKISHNQAPE
jgi:hypothetical protein